MKTLEEHLVERFHTEVSRLWAVADPDGLFRSDVVNRLLAERGIEIVVFEEPIAFRFFYETTMLPKLQTGDAAYAILFDPRNDGFLRLPADIYGQSQKIEVSLGDLYPKLSRSVLKELDPAVLARIWEKTDALPAVPAGDRESCDIVLRLGYRIEPTLIESFTDVIRLLLELHFSKKNLPNPLVLRLAEVARGACQNLDEWLRKPAAFQRFLQDEWGEFVEGSKSVKFSGQGAVDFEDPGVRVFLDDLFNEGFLQPVNVVGANLPEWVKSGAGSKKPRRSADLESQRGKLLETLPGDASTYQDWLTFAQHYAHHVAAVFTSDNAGAESANFWPAVWEPVNAAFTLWATSRLDTLHNLPPTRPAVIHHIPKFLARRVKLGRRVALLVLDGLSLSQWEIVKNGLREKVENLRFVDDASFSLVPSITNVCRQALYAGESPAFLAGSLGRTDLDANRWKAFWSTALSQPVTCDHTNIQGQPSDLPEFQIFCQRSPVALGATVRMPDEIMHGSKLGWTGMAQQLRLWAGGEFLAAAIAECLANGYEVFLAADHGNLESVGEGAFSQGALVDRSGERVRIYSDATIRQKALADLGARAFAPAAKLLPDDFLPILHSGRGAFIPKGESRVCHGGLSLDEMVVPFVEITGTA